MPRLRIALVPVAFLSVVACALPSPIVPPIGPRGNVGSGEDAKVAAEGVNAFAADLYSHLRETDGNLIVSPYSISTALAMAAAGAQGETRTEMERVLHLPPGEKLGPSFAAMTQSVTTPPRTAKHKQELAVANSLWLQKGHSWKREYLARAREDFRAGLFEVDFADATGASGRINKWVEDKTRDKIKDLVTPDALGGNTRIVLANAIYFKAKWAEQFKKDDTKPDDFTLANGQKVRAPLMFQGGNFLVRETDGIQVLRLPYSGEDTSMYVLLPRTADGLPALEQQLTAQNLSNWTLGPGKEALEEVRVWLPKFKFTVPTELAGVLGKMGMSEAFNVQRANFRGISDHPEGLYITRVIHKAFVELDEVGTEAAAATAVVGLAGAIPNGPVKQVREFRADHPFVFVIKHEPTGAALFVGRVLNPTM
jgi:serpin B